MNSIKKIIQKILSIILITFLMFIALCSIANVFMRDHLNRIAYDAALKKSNRNREEGITLEEIIAVTNKQLHNFSDANFPSSNSIFIEGDNVVWQFVIDSTLFYPNYKSKIFPESLIGDASFVVNSQDNSIDLDTVLTNEMMRRQHREMLLYYTLFARQTPPSTMYKKIIERHYGQVWRYLSPFSDKYYEYTFSYEELKRVDAYCRNNYHKALQEFIKEYIKAKNFALSIANLKSDVTMDMAWDDDYLFFNYTFGRSSRINGVPPIQYFKNNNDYLERCLNDDLKNIPFFYCIDEICIKTKRQLMFRFTDYQNSDYIDITFF